LDHSCYHADFSRVMHVSATLVQDQEHNSTLLDALISATCPDFGESDPTSLGGAGSAAG
jgi:hypothetical protein